MSKSLEDSEAYCQSVIDHWWTYATAHAPQIQRMYNEGHLSPDDCEVMFHCLGLVLMEIAKRRLAEVTDELQRLKKGSNE